MGPSEKKKLDGMIDTGRNTTIEIYKKGVNPAILRCIQEHEGEA